MHLELQKNLQMIRERKVVNICDYQRVDIMASDQTVAQIKSICNRTGLTPSQVIEGIIRTALEEKNFTLVSQTN